MTFGDNDTAIELRVRSHVTLVGCECTSSDLDPTGINCGLTRY